MHRPVHAPLEGGHLAACDGGAVLAGDRAGEHERRPEDHADGDVPTFQRPHGREIHPHEGHDALRVVHLHLDLGEDHALREQRREVDPEAGGGVSRPLDDGFGQDAAAHRDPPDPDAERSRGRRALPHDLAHEDDAPGCGDFGGTRSSAGRAAPPRARAVRAAARAAARGRGDWVRPGFRAALGPERTLDVGIPAAVEDLAPAEDPEADRQAHDHGDDRRDRDQDHPPGSHV